MASSSCDDDFGLLGDGPQPDRHPQSHHLRHLPQQQSSAAASFVAHRLAQTKPGAAIVSPHSLAATGSAANEDPVNHGEAFAFVSYLPEDDGDGDDGDSNRRHLERKWGATPGHGAAMDAHESRLDAKRKDRGETGGGGSPYYYGGGDSGKKPKPPSSMDCRKDREEWSDSAIECLLDAYTERYVQLNRGNLRGRDWEDVATIVSERCDQQKSGKSVEQCKNKVDNLKKRYKSERQRLNGGGLSVSHWPWFKKMELVVGSPSTCAKPVSEDEKPTVVGGRGSSPDAVVRQNKRYVANSGTVSLTSNLKTKPLPTPRWRRVVLKICGDAFIGNGSQSVDPKMVTLIAREIAAASHLGVEVAIVVGGRNFFCGDSWVAATGTDRSSAHQIGMMATVMNSILLQASLERIGVQTRVQTSFMMQEVAEPYTRRKAIQHLEKGRIVIFGGGAGTSIPLFSTDTAAALRASELGADAVLKGIVVDSIYDCYQRNISNVTFEHISFSELPSRGFSAMDLTAITFCEENNIPVMVFNLLESGNISKALCGDEVGTLIDRSGRIS